MMTNLASILLDSAAEHADATALKLDDAVLTYAALERLSGAVAAQLTADGVQPGDRVALISPNVPQMPVVYYGILRAGAVVVPLNPLLTAREIEYHLTDSGAARVWVWEGMADAARTAADATGASITVIDSGPFLQSLARTDPTPGLVERDDAETAVILYTSGTTGRPKGAELTHANLRGNALMSAGLFALGPGDVLFGGLPFFHVFGQTSALNAAIAQGGALTLLPRFDPAAAKRIIERDRVTVFLGVPTMYIALLRDPSPVDASSLRVAVSGGAPLPVEVLHEFERAYKATLLEGYGLSETSPAVAFNQLDGVRKPGSIGTPVPGAQLRVDDGDGGEAADDAVGELLVAGPYVMKGYWKNPDATAAAIVDGWFHTGDLARRDAEGVYVIVDRKKDMILRGGYNVYPREVEEVLYEHPAVAEAAVIGIPDDLNGQEVAAVVALKAEHRDDDTEQLIADLTAWTKERLAAYKYPRRIAVVDALPKGPTGKILKREISLDG
ncbi:long-chain-fatty-acid--CoA ligase [Tersicoccus solisilvae]|uniref:Long-chain-fatty-acid--CoA ligase n=1 Tax=Tersicoccus solisilvae TaxID=1882339 RepID=A0ABQ1PEV7_9MICC|nr:long-chain fatty acid--CoA ligase [Tersicoccus solisilvae]GGC95783.1 long-chain-fatty-acid--CoA ligase [Tersicoccus solisilvae]